MLIKKQAIMTIGVVPNGFELAKDVVKKSLHTFLHVPIIYNENQTFKAYSSDTLFENYLKTEKVIGMISSEPFIKNNVVYADITILDEFQELWKNKIDNWCIDIKGSIKTAHDFKLCCLEVFGGE
jgi:hypothetical protein